ncbi:MAG: SpoIIE family protein phosphatase [Bacteroidetes bacterium]|nr:SpoIIE family protein phosphatase [Bacteroidota bacterium]
MKVGLSLVFIALLQFSALAQRLPDPVFHTLEAEMLGVNTARYQTWDSRGRLWVLTDKGLLCYDGYRSTLIESEKGSINSPLATNLRSLIKVAEDEFWITYSDQNAISKFNPVANRYQHFYPDSLNEHALPDVPLAKILYENDSIRWLATWGAGLCRLNVQTGYVTRYANDNDVISAGEPPTNMVKEIVKLDADKYLVGFFQESTYTTPYYFEPSTGMFSKMELAPFLEKHDERMAYLIEKALTMINFIYHDPRGNLWFGTYIGLVYLDVSNQTITRISGKENDLHRQNLENTRSYVLDQNGLIWAGTPNQGILLVDPLTAEVKYIRHNVTVESSLSDDRLTTVSTDPLGNIWIATDAGTFSICSPLTQNFDIHPWSGMHLDFSDRSSQQIPVNQILVQDNGKIVISNANGLIEYNSLTAETTTFINPKQDAWIRDFHNLGILHFRKVGDDLFFIVHNENKQNIVYRYNLETKKAAPVIKEYHLNRLLFRHADSLAPVLFFLSKEGSGLYTYNNETNRIDSISSIPDSLIIAENFTLMLNSGKWMVPFIEGHFGIFDPQTHQTDVYHHHATTHFFPDSTINCAYKETSGIVWIGTQTAIYRFDETNGEILRYNEQIGLGEKEKINVITQDRNGTFWICLAKDMVQWNPETGHFFRFNKSHGLNPGTFLPAVAQKDAAGTIYVACYNGILVFNPDKIQIPANKLQLYLASARLYETVLDTSLLLSGQQHFANDENYFTFEFHTNEIFTLTPSRFYFRLAGRDEEWQDNGISNRIRLADLGPGSYTLEVKSINTFGHESNTLKIPFTIAQPFWFTWWFILMTAGLLGLIVWLYIRYREKALRKRSIELEKTVTERTAEVVAEKKEADKQRQEAEHQKEIVEEKQKEISDSINYAKRIQNAILPSERYFKTHLPDSFILYLPKDIVAGDFYFMENVGDTIILAVADCTGHGVPGAMVSVLCHNALIRSVKEFGLTLPNEILDKTRELVLETFAKSEDQVNDGMDIALCVLDKKTRKLFFAGANNGLFLIRKEELIEYKPDKQPIGKFIHAKPFTRQEIQLLPGDRVYLYSDGYADQFGGEAGKPGGKKFKYSRLKTLIHKIHTQKADQQHDLLLETLVQWRGEIEQVDDICIIGFSAS